MKRLIAAALTLLCVAAAQRSSAPHWAAGTISAAPYPYIRGSVIPLDVTGIRGPFAFVTSSDAAVEDGRLTLSDSTGTSATVIAAGRKGLAMHNFAVTAPPPADRAFIAVASYDDGVVIHDPQAPFTVRGVLGIGGAPADVAIDSRGVLASADTDGTTATLASLQPWQVRTIGGVPFADELAFDSRTGALFVTDRDIDGFGAITRIDPDGTTRHRVLGLTSEGLAVDPKRGLVYVANVNDGSVSVVDAGTLVERRRFHAVSRVFSLALSADGALLYAVSNQSLDSPFAAPGGVVLYDVRGTRSHLLARSGPLHFPVGIALDEAYHRIYVTDESDDSIDVLDAHTLRPLHDPLQTCDVPWKPQVDDGLLYVPCARSGRIDVFDTRTLHRIAGAPFITGGYPLAVAIWHGR